MKQEHITAAGERTALTTKDPSIVFVLQDFLETVSVVQVRSLRNCINFITLTI